MSVFRVCCPCCVYGDIVATFPQDTEGVCCAGKWGLACCGYYSVGLIPYVGHVLRCGELCVFVNVFVCAYVCVRVPDLFRPEDTNSSVSHNKAQAYTTGKILQCEAHVRAPSVEKKITHSQSVCLEV